MNNFMEEGKMTIIQTEEERNAELIAELEAAGIPVNKWMYCHNMPLTTEV